MDEVLEGVIEVLEEAPHSAASLTLYALVSTLEFEQAGYMFKLSKLRDLSSGQRELAFGLMELMAAGKNSGETWGAAKRRMDSIIRAG